MPNAFPAQTNSNRFNFTPRPNNISAGDPVPDFHLINQSDRTIHLDQFKGKLVLMTFIYTRCPLPDYCFRLTNNFGRLQKRFKERMGRDLILLSITFDPANDTPEALTAYAERFKADRSRWFFLTGEKDAIRRLAVEGLKLPLADGDPSQGEDPILHSQRFVLVDAESRVRATYDVRDQEAMFKLRGDLQRLIEKSAS